LATLLWESLPEQQSSAALDPQYEAEVVRRIEEIDSGRAKMLTLEEVMSHLRKSSS
jgi:putative addiction module component (TIGR02574 family)